MLQHFIGSNHFSLLPPVSDGLLLPLRPSAGLRQPYDERAGVLMIGRVGLTLITFCIPHTSDGSALTFFWAVRQ
jgi:hypothetical protein